ncbi:hypothetical protein GH714_005556 [Hevea brasiliensis]|uniref:Cytochrome P450 n=1 Tax=Hevea brasiliensis TaxID=3981 RepID=A0A6A6MBW2_HEVBR|nr:hypothetical protein GH714_005556 [Hevea brasiliensis]
MEVDIFHLSHSGRCVTIYSGRGGTWVASYREFAATEGEETPQDFHEGAEIHGPIYSIRTGASTIIVLNSTDVAKEAMVTRYSSISTRKLSKALTVLTQDKCMVATSDYDEFHKMVKRCILTSVLGTNAQRRHRCHRDTLIENISNQLHAHVDTSPDEAVNFREIFESGLFGIALKEALGKDVQSVYVDEFGSSLSREEIFKVLVLDPMEGAIAVDWRDFFPYLSWIPNKRWELNIQQMHLRRQAVMNAFKGAKETNCLRRGYALSANPKCMKHSPVPVIPLRYAHEDTELGGYYIPAGSEIAINIYGCNMDKKQWIKPEEWKPERFLDGKYDPKDLHKTIGFGAGKRACAGALQALLVGCTSIGRLIQEFEWRLRDGEEDNVDLLDLPLASFNHCMPS